MDKITSEQRSQIMRRVKSRNTAPEMIVRSLLHGIGYRFRLHDAGLPGTPDIVLPRHRKIIFVHGCFWHGHQGCPAAARPTTNVEFWAKKLDKNIERDKSQIEKLEKSGWKVLIVWECQTVNRTVLGSILNDFMNS